MPPGDFSADLADGDLRSYPLASNWASAWTSFDARIPKKSTFHAKTNEKGQLATNRKLALVEAAGIEPASRNISMQASTYVVELLNLTKKHSDQHDY